MSARSPSPSPRSRRQICLTLSTCASPKIWENKADFNSKIPPVLAAIKGQKGKITDVASTKVAFDDINAKCNGCHETYQVKARVTRRDRTAPDALYARWVAAR